MSSRTGIYSWINDHTFVLLASTDLAFSVRCFLNPPISWLSPKLRSFDFKDRRSGFKGKKMALWSSHSVFSVCCWWSYSTVGGGKWISPDVEQVGVQVEAVGEAGSVRNPVGSHHMLLQPGPGIRLPNWEQTNMERTNSRLGPVN